MGLNKLFCDVAVLQAGKPIRIFGTGNGDEWHLEMPAHTCGGPYTMKVVLNGSEKLIKYVYFGDV